MFAVLKQFRVIIQSIKTHYQGVERQCGVSGAQLWALGQIGETPGITVGELARALAIHQSTASNLLARLEALSLVERTRGREDQRVVSIQLTARGRGVLRRAPKPFRGVLQQALTELPSSTLAGLHTHVGRLIRQMGAPPRGAESMPISTITTPRAAVVPRVSAPRTRPPARRPSAARDAA